MLILLHLLSKRGMSGSLPTVFSPVSQACKGVIPSTELTCYKVFRTGPMKNSSGTILRVSIACL